MLKVESFTGPPIVANYSKLLSPTLNLVSSIAWKDTVASNLVKSISVVYSTADWESVGVAVITRGCLYSIEVSK